MFTSTGISNGEYDASYYMIKKGDKTLILSDIEGMEISRRVREVDERDRIDPNNKKEQEFLKELEKL